MAISATRLPDEPIIIVKYIDPPDPPDEQAAETSHQMSALMKDIEGPVYRINDILDYDLQFSDMVLGMAAEMRGGLPGTVSDSRVHTVTVGSSELVRIGTEAAKQSQYGEIDIKLFTSIDDALSYVREEIAKNK